MMNILALLRAGVEDGKEGLDSRSKETKREGGNETSADEVFDYPWKSAYDLNSVQRVWK